MEAIRTDDIALNKLSADFGLNSFVATAWLRITVRLKEILKRRALFGNQTVVLLTGSGALTNSGASKPFFFLLL
jgi:hypothetical protein